MLFLLKNTTNLIQAPLFFLWDFHPKFRCHLYVLKDTEYAKDNEKEIQDRDSAAKEINADHNGDEKVGSE